MRPTATANVLSFSARVALIVASERTVDVSGGTLFIRGQFALPDDGVLASPPTVPARSLISTEVRMTSRRFVFASSILAVTLASAFWTAVAASPLEQTGTSRLAGPISVSFHDAPLPSVLRIISTVSERTRRSRHFRSGDCGSERHAMG
jgi:hypothetical protein